MSEPFFSTLFSRIRLKNFRCYEDSGNVPLRPLTIIVGPNNSGKSTLIDALLLLKQTITEGSPAASPLITKGSDVDLGGYYDILRGGRSAKTTSFQIELESSYAGFEEGRLSPSDGDKSSKTSKGTLSLSVSFDFDKARSAPYVQSVRADHNQSPVVELFAKSQGGRPDKYDIGSVDPEIAPLLAAHLSSFLPYVHPVTDAPPPQEKLKQVLELTSLSTQVYAYWANMFAGIRFIAPLRDEIPRLGLVGQTTAQRRGRSGEELLRMMSSKEEISPQGRTLEQEVDKWLAKKLKLARRVRLKRLGATDAGASLLIDERKGFSNINAADMGQGISQVLPVLAHVLGADYDDCVVIEQPEIHLHPSLQANLADLFVEKVVGGNAHQVIVETHSEHLLLRIRRRIADGHIPAEKVVILYVDRQGAQSKVTQIDIDKKGVLSEWPEGFFEEDFEEAYELSRAASRQNP